MPGLAATVTNCDVKTLANPVDVPTGLPTAIGDVRSGNVKRVASAVGEGFIVIRLLHKSLQPSLGDSKHGRRFEDVAVLQRALDMLCVLGCYPLCPCGDVYNQRITTHRGGN
jgi:hypothetical protein